MTELEALKELTNLCQGLAKNHVALVQEVRELRQALREVVALSTELAESCTKLKARIAKLEDSRGVPRRMGGV